MFEYKRDVLHTLLRMGLHSHQPVSTPMLILCHLSQLNFACILFSITLIDRLLCAVQLVTRLRKFALVENENQKTSLHGNNAPGKLHTLFRNGLLKMISLSCCSSMAPSPRNNLKDMLLSSWHL